MNQYSYANFSSLLRSLAIGCQFIDHIVRRMACDLLTITQRSTRYQVIIEENFVLHAPALARCVAPKATQVPLINSEGL